MVATPVTDEVVAQVDAILPTPIFAPTVEVGGWVGIVRAQAVSWMLLDLEHRMFGPNAEESWREVSASFTPEQWAHARTALQDARARVDAELAELQR